MAQGSAINDILQMRQQGVSNNQIIQNLQRQGYTNTQIFDAMNQADAKMAVEGVQPGVLQQAPDTSSEVQEVFTAPPEDIPGTGNISSGAINYGVEDTKVEELVEAIIEEKWSELVRDVNKIVDWKNKVEGRLSEIEVKLDDIKQNFSDLNKAVLGKVNDYDRHISEVGSNVQAMEKVFSKVLPVFTENVNELSRIASRIKSKEG